MLFLEVVHHHPKSNQRASVGWAWEEAAPTWRQHLIHVEKHLMQVKLLKK